jgi:hypothetical protein
MLKWSWWVVVITFVAGCATTAPSVSQLDKSLDVGGSQADRVVIGVLDSRPAVVSGEKAATVIGQYKLRFGDAYDAHTFSKKPMAEDFSDKLVELLGGNFGTMTPVLLKPSVGHDGAVDQLLEHEGDKFVLLTLKEWTSFTSSMTSLEFDAQLEVFNADKELLAYKRTKGEDTYGGNSIAGPITNSKTVLPHAFRQKMKALFEAPMVKIALTDAKPAPIIEQEKVVNESGEVVPQACTVVQVLYWKNSGMPDDEIILRCQAVISH